MTKRKMFMKMYLASSSGKSLSEKVAEEVSFVVENRSILTTEVIRDGGFVHGRMSPIQKNVSMLDLPLNVKELSA